MSSLLQALKLLHEIVIVHGHHPLERGQEVPRVDLHLGHVLEDYLAFILILLFLDQRADRSMVAADLARGDPVQLNYVVAVQSQLDLQLPVVNGQAI